MALISDAGCPGIADPGAEVVKLAHKKGINVEERNVESGEWSMRELQEAVPGARAFPQIFIDGKYIGGYDKMMSHVQMGELSL